MKYSTMRSRGPTARTYFFIFGLSGDCPGMLD
jgi:hypothetical protein